MKRILVTGAFGLVGSDLVPELQKKFGPDSVVALARETVSSDFKGILEKGDVRDSKLMADLVKKHDIGEIYHLAGLLSAGGEKQPDLAWEINVDGLKHVLDLAKEHQLKVFWPSSIAAFGPSTPKQNVPQHTSLEPTTMYGVTKVTGELLCQYYFEKYGVDAVRYFLLGGLSAYGDGDWSEERFENFYTAHLVNGIGNLTSRILTMIEKYQENKVPAVAVDIFETEKFWLDYESAFAKFDFEEVVKNINSLVSKIDLKISEEKPWEKVKTGEDISVLLYQLVEGLRHLALSLVPIIPGTAEKILSQLNLEVSDNFAEEKKWGLLQEGKEIKKADILFVRLEK